MANGFQPSVNVDSNSFGNGGGLDFSSLLPSIISKFVNVLEAAFILFCAFFVIKFIKSKIEKIEAEHESQKTALNLLEKITSGFIVIISVTIALKVVGIDITLLVSVAILGLSYGLQDIIKNYVAGILILFKSPFKIGDVVQIRSYTGKVTKIDFQSTTLETFDKRHVTIYNSDVMTQSIVNFTNNSVRRLNFDIRLGYGTDTHKALKIFERILSDHPQVLKEPKFSINFKQFEDTGVTFTLKFWIQRPCNILKIKTEIASVISQAFDEDNILMPFTRGIEADNENALINPGTKRKERAQKVYSSQLFTNFAPTDDEFSNFISPTAELSVDAEEPE